MTTTRPQRRGADLTANEMALLLRFRQRRERAQKMRELCARLSNGPGLQYWQEVDAAITEQDAAEDA